MDEIEIPQYFVCPISLQIMRDPVTAVTGITYDRESIEQWLNVAAATTCPVTKQPLPKDSDLTPNHMLRRLIQAWCTANANNGVDRIPTPKPVLTKSQLFKLVRDLRVPQLSIAALKRLQEIAEESEKNRKCMGETGVVMKETVGWVIKCFKEAQTTGLHEAFHILHLIWTPNGDNKALVRENFDFVGSVTWVLQSDHYDGLDDNQAREMKTHALLALKAIVEVLSSSLMERLKVSFFEQAMRVLRERALPQQAIKATLHVLIEVCLWGSNRTKMIEAGAVFELVDLGLDSTEKKMTELVFCLLAHLCSCAEGRAQLVKHAGGIALLTKRILRVSPGTDDRALRILGLISRFSASREVLMEMLRVGAVSKICMVLQADSQKHLKNKAREVLKMHSDVWNNSPCIAVYLLTMYPR